MLGPLGRESKKTVNHIHHSGEEEAKRLSGHSLELFTSPAGADETPLDDSRMGIRTGMYPWGEVVLPFGPATPGDPRKVWVETAWGSRQVALLTVLGTDWILFPFRAQCGTREPKQCKMKPRWEEIKLRRRNIKTESRWMGKQWALGQQAIRKGMKAASLEKQRGRRRKIWYLRQG